MDHGDRHVGWVGTKCSRRMEGLCLSKEGYLSKGKQVKTRWVVVRRGTTLRFGQLLFIGPPSGMFVYLLNRWTGREYVCSII